MKFPNPLSTVRTVSAFLNAAEREARAVGEDLPGAEHMLLAALDLDEGSAGRVFARVGADPRELRAAIAAQHADALRAIGIEPPDDAPLAATEGLQPPKGLPKASPSGRAVLRAATDFQKRRRGSRLLGAHVVGAVAQMEYGSAARALRSLGIDRDALRAAAEEEIDSA